MQLLRNFLDISEFIISKHHAIDVINTIALLYIVRLSRINTELNLPSMS